MRVHQQRRKVYFTNNRNVVFFFPATDIDFKKDSLVQEFVTNPFLIDNRKFTLGVFVAFSSNNPTRTYLLNSEVYLRFTNKEYDPSNFTDTRTYIADGLGQGPLLMEEVKTVFLFK